MQIIPPSPLISSLPSTYTKEKPQGHSPHTGDDLGAVVLKPYLVLQIEGGGEVETTGLVRPIDIGRGSSWSHIGVTLEGIEEVLHTGL